MRSMDKAKSRRLEVCGDVAVCVHDGDPPRIWIVSEDGNEILVRLPFVRKLCDALAEAAGLAVEFYISAEVHNDGPTSTAGDV